MSHRTSKIIGVMLGMAAVTLGLASYLHRDGDIRLGFTVIRGENFLGASTPEAVIAAVLAVAAAVVFIAPRRARPAALGATAFAILGTAFGMTVTIPRGRTADIVYHSVLLAWLLATGALLLRRDRPAATQRPSDQEHQAVTPTRR
jgi:heme A synthase